MLYKSLEQLKDSEDRVEVEKFSLVRTLIRSSPEKKRKSKISSSGRQYFCYMIHPTAPCRVLNKLFPKHVLNFFPITSALPFFFPLSCSPIT